MPEYVYRCPDCKKEKLVVHSVKECDEHKEKCECGAEMKRRPAKGMRFGFSPFDILTRWSEENLRRKKAGEPLFSKDRVNRPEKPIPQRDYDRR